MSASHSSSDASLHTVREPRKQKRLDFNKVKQTFDLTPLRSHSDNRSDSWE